MSIGNLDLAEAVIAWNTGSPYTPKHLLKELKVAPKGTYETRHLRYTMGGVCADVERMGDGQKRAELARLARELHEDYGFRVSEIEREFRKIVQYERDETLRWLFEPVA